MSSDLKILNGVAHAEKYQSGNPISNYLVRGFLRTIRRHALATGMLDFHEVGCGEGHVLAVLAAEGLRVRGCDVSEESLAVARTEAARNALDMPVSLKSVYDLTPEEDAADVILCCEVLEHLTDPELALDRLVSVARNELILSVPNEPVWHVLNMLRGKYLNALGNTPGHFQHWTGKQFVEFVGSRAEIIEVSSPLPWTVVRCRPKKIAASSVGAQR